MFGTKGQVAKGRRINGDTKSASLAEAERTIEFLEAENKKLKEELTDTKSMYIQLTKENRHEKFDERRVTFLKAQLIQVERQMLLLNDALGTRMHVVLEAENALQCIADKCRECKNQEARIGGFFISNDELNRIIEAAESARLKLFKNIENTSMQRLHKPVQFMDQFVKQTDRKPCTLLDVCTGELDHINLKQVGKLESKLSELYSQLQRVNNSLVVQLFHDESQHTRLYDIAPQANYVKMLGECSKACNMLNELLPDMLELSVLVPTAPWPAITKPIVKELTVDHVMERMPALSKAKSQQAAQTIAALLKVLSFSQLKATSQEKTYQEELKFHKNVYELQLEYIENLFNALRVAYEQFESDTNELICAPLDKVLGIYQSLKKTAAEEALRVFLATFKEYEPQMKTAVARLKKDETLKGQDEALSSYAKEFFMKLDDLQLKCQEKRDQNIDELQDIKEQQKSYWVEIRKLMQDSYIEDQDRETNSSFTARNKKHGAKDRDYGMEKGWDSSTDIEKNDSTLGTINTTSTCARRSSVGDVNSAQKQVTNRQREKLTKNSDFSAKSQSDMQIFSPNEPNAQEQSELLFKSMLRGGLDDSSGFVFDIDTEINSPVGESRRTPASKTQKGRPPLAKSSGKPMKGVAQSKLVLKPIPVQNRNTSRPRSETPEVQQTLSDNREAGDSSTDDAFAHSTQQYDYTSRSFSFPRHRPNHWR